jgi:predicted outer membrane protein
MNDFEKDARKTTPRRTFLTRMAVGGIGIAALGLAASAEAAATPQQPAADTGHDYPMPAPHAMTEKEFRMGVIGPATLSRITSELAIDKATNAAAKEFANFELREAIAVLTVLKSLGTPTPPMDAKAKATLAKIQSAQGMAFDRAYIAAQLANHEFLRDLAETYLNNSAGHTSVAEIHGRHLATLSLATFKEHVVHTKNITAELQG